MALLNHSEVKNTGKKILTRGPKIETTNKVNRGDIELKPTVNEQPSSKGKNVLTSYVTEPVNIRVDNHIRNYIAALITMGHSDTQKDMVELVLNLYIENLSNGELKRFEDLVQIYEDKDVKKHQKKVGL
ncbi:hypothetical protein SAMN04488048_1324 [Trichococcus flocculiformis]|jgi:hypothetical protein|uniref:DUF5388 domain-containing protein n=1 Tax=Trichococcus TaxID=82802 RepID=UPI0007A8111C|nr:MULTISPECIES: DUF5388 domain-containing protein [Trichococcus]MDU1847797.1 DUF5388 domain-containing protein [Niallia nealsonii]CZR09930.1 Hypothetical protein TES5_2782 [Trichococcus sp. ES5]SHG14671.1 hypothetical protein SAMN04488048_1324 [Trichococcus flocculiformis]